MAGDRRPAIAAGDRPGAGGLDAGVAPGGHDRDGSLGRPERGRARARVLALSAALLLGLFIVAACGESTQSPSPVPTNVVDLPKSYRFVPAAITVPAGTTVTWTNHDDFTHNIHLFDDGDVTYTLKPGEAVSFTFTTEGLHRFECSLHPRDMQGSVLVTLPG